MLAELRKTLDAWKWSWVAIARSPLPIVALAAIVALWSLAGYGWLGLPESSALMLVVTLVWAVAQLALAVAVVAGVTAGAGNTAALANGRLPVSSVATFKGRQFLRCLAWLIVSLVVIYLVASAFAWVNDHLLEVASFVTFHTSKPTSYHLLSRIFEVIEDAVGLMVLGFLATFLIHLLAAGWRAAWRERRRSLADCVWRGSFLTSVLGALVFVWLVGLLIDWHPIVKPGFLDYAQVVLRMAGALILRVVGLLFWLLALARIALAKGETPAT